MSRTRMSRALLSAATLAARQALWRALLSGDAVRGTGRTGELNAVVFKRPASVVRRACVNAAERNVSCRCRGGSLREREPNFGHFPNYPSNRTSRQANMAGFLLANHTEPNERRTDTPLSD